MTTRGCNSSTKTQRS